MTGKEILEGNKLIAEFMGADISTPKDKDIIYMSITMCNELVLPNNCGAVKVRHLDYHESWDWLMPVVEKIESLGISMPISIHWHGTYIGTSKDVGRVSGYIKGGNRLNHTYACVTEFIKQYNNGKWNEYLSV